MTQHPNQLWAAAAGWSLRVSLAELRREAQATRAVAADEDDDRGCLRSWAPSIGRSAGGHGDSVAAAAVFAPGRSGTNRYQAFADSTTDTITWIVRRTLPETPTGSDYLDAIIAAVDTFDPDTARVVGRWLDESDKRARQALGMAPDHRQVPANPPCPGCGDRLLRLQTSAPDPQNWTIICVSACPCRGAECGCGMSVPAAGVPHIWASNAARVVAGLPRRRVRTRRAAAQDDVRDEGAAA